MEMEKKIIDQVKPSVEQVIAIEVEAKEKTVSGREGGDSKRNDVEVNAKDKTISIGEGAHSKTLVGENKRKQLGTRKKLCVASASVAYHRTNMYFSEIEGGLSKNELLFRLIHWWEARNPKMDNVLIGMEMLLIDEQGDTIKGYISPNQIPKFEPEFKAGSIYRLTHFYGRENKATYRVADHPQTVCFTYYSQLNEVHDDIPEIETDFFRIKPFAEFEANADKGLGLYDVIGKIEHIDGNTIQQDPNLARVRGNLADHEKEKFTIHLKLAKELVIVNLWDKAAVEFGEKYRASNSTPVVLLLTTVNLKRSNGRVTLSSMSPSRVFIDDDIPTTKEFLASLGDIGRMSITVKRSECRVIKLETLTLAEIQHFVQNQPPQNARFETLAQVVNVVTDYGWYYISCSRCKKKLTPKANTLVCNVCKNPKPVGVISYRVELAVKDENSTATLVLFDRVAAELTGIHASEYVENYHNDKNMEAREDKVPIPQGLLDTIGKTYRFEVKITDYNFTARRQTLTVDRMLEPVEIDGSVEVDEVPSEVTSVNGEQASNEPKYAELPSAEKPSKRSRK